MPLTIVEVIQLVAKGYLGALAIVGTDDVIDVFNNEHNDPMYSDRKALDTPMDQQRFYRAYQHRQFEPTDSESVMPDVEPESDDDEEAEPEETEIDPNDFNTWPDQDLSDYLVEEAGEERRNWKRSTMIKKITRYAETGSAD